MAKFYKFFSINNSSSENLVGFFYFEFVDPAPDYLSDD